MKIFLIFLDIKDIQVSFSDDALGSHTIYISVFFNLKKDPLTTSSLQLSVTGDQVGIMTENPTETKINDNNIVHTLGG